MAKKRKRKVRKGIVFCILLLFLLIAGSGGFYIWYRVSLRPASDVPAEQTIEITEGESHDQLVEDLVSRGLIRSKTAANLYARFHDLPYYTGNYRVNGDMSTPEILEYIADPNNQESTYAVVTIPEGFWAKQVAARLANLFPEYTADTFLDLWNDPAYIEELSQTYSFIDPAVLDNDAFFVKLEGYLYPETYFVDYGMTPDAITRMFLDGFANMYTQIADQVEASDMTLEEILTFASVVQFESGNPEDMKDIAGVFYNRLEQGMPLGSSVTVCYALYDDFQNHQDCEVNTDIDSPYNTYLHPGLPVGPILNPGIDAIEAVLNPNDNDYLYFVADIYGDGSVHYARTYEEHMANVEKYNLIIE